MEVYSWPLLSCSVELVCVLSSLLPYCAFNLMCVCVCVCVCVCWDRVLVLPVARRKEEGAGPGDTPSWLLSDQTV